MVEYRPIPDRREIFHEYRSYAFAPESGPPSYDPEDHDTPRALLGEPRGVFDVDEDENGVGNGTEDADPRAVCRHYWFDARVRGEWHPTAGLAAVATPPEHRRGGYVGELLERSLAEYRERGNRFAILWPFKYAFYRRYGWDTCNRVVTHECAPADLAFASAATGESGSFRRVDAAEYDVIEPAYEGYAERFALTLGREPDWWRYRLLENYDTDPFVYAYERDGRVRGYLIYTIDRESDGEGLDARTMDVSELAFDEHRDLLALLAFCHRHDSQVRRVRFRVPESVPILDVATDPDEFETDVKTGPMARIVDVADALSALSYPDVDATVTFDVSDPVADWNDGRFALSIADGDGRCEHEDGDRSGAAGESDVRVDIGALSQLAVGYRSATDLERTGRLDVTSENAAGVDGESNVVETLSTLFPETDVFLGDRF